MLQTKALYNLLKLQRTENPAFAADAWALEDLRPVKSEEIFARLRQRKIDLDKKSFLEFAENCDTPEDLAELLSSEEEDEKQYDANYLLIFELWRRQLPEKQSLSLFGDELDHRIALYEAEDLENDEPIQDALANLLEILEENSDAGANPHEIFAAIGDYCAHDLDSFIVDYISDILDSGNEAYASELIEGFSPYTNETAWFELLQARLDSFKNIAEANRKIRKIIEKGQDPSLLLEILHFLTSEGEHDLFVMAVKKILPLLKRKEELFEVMEIAADYYRRLDRDEIEEAIQNLMADRKEGPLSHSDPDMIKLHQILLSKE